MNPEKAKILTSTRSGWQWYEKENAAVCSRFFFFHLQPQVLYLFIFLLSIILLSSFTFNWKIIALQYGLGLCHTWTGIGHRYIQIFLRDGQTEAQKIPVCSSPPLYPVLHLLRVISDEPASLPSRTFFAVSQRLCTTPYSDRSFSPSKAPLNAHSHHVSLALSLSYFFFSGFLFCLSCGHTAWHVGA